MELLPNVGLALSYASPHSNHFVAAFHLSEDTLHSPELSLVSVAMHFGNGVFNNNHSIIVLYAAANGG